MPSLVRKLWKAVDRYRLNTAPVVVGVSGGPDSVALLRALRDVGVVVVVAHVNHALRGDESEADETFVRELATGQGCACHVRRAGPNPGENLEAACRALRYEWFEIVARDAAAGFIATGHTRDDQAETVLHRLIRGTGLRGLRGIAPRNGNLVRPLLDASRAEVLDYLASLGQPYRIDSSNVDPRFTRNRIRHKLLPLLKSLNPEVAESLGEVAEQAAEAFTLVESSTAELLARVERPRAGRLLVFDAGVLGATTPYLVCEMFRAVWAREGWKAGAMTAEHWRRLAAIARGEVPTADFPDGVTARRVGRVVQVERRT